MIDTTISRFCCPLLRLTYIVLLWSLITGQSDANDSFRIASQNMNRLFDDVDNGKKYETVLSTQKFQGKAKLAAHKIIHVFKLPDIIALQEVENMNTLSQVAHHIRQVGSTTYKPVLKPGNDVSGINVGFLIKTLYRVKSIQQLFKKDRLTLDNSFLFSRPPLLVEVCKQLHCLSILNLHLRSMRGIRKQPNGQRVRIKRQQQASAIARWIDQYQRTHPEHSLIVLGDFNALSPTDRYIDVVGTIKGNPDNRKTQLSSKDWIRNDLIDLTERIPHHQRYSYIHRKKKQIIDYLLINESLNPRLKNIQLTGIDYQFSDHAGVIADFSW